MHQLHRLANAFRLSFHFQSAAKLVLETLQVALCVSSLDPTSLGSQPSVSLSPTLQVGYDAEGLPIGLQLIGRPWSEATLLRLASALEKLFLPARKKPTVVYFDILKKQGPHRGASGP